MSVLLQIFAVRVKEKWYFYSLDVLDIFGNHEEQFQLPMSNWTRFFPNKAMFDGSSIEGFVPYQQIPDMYLCRFGYGRSSLGRWWAQRGSLICDVYDRRRTICRRPTWQLETCPSSYGRTWIQIANLDPEPEFFLFKLDENDPTQ